VTIATSVKEGWLLSCLLGCFTSGFLGSDTGIFDTLGFLGCLQSCETLTLLLSFGFSNKSSLFSFSFLL
jgi:hypothetical protein